MTEGVTKEDMDATALAVSYLSTAGHLAEVARLPVSSEMNRSLTEFNLARSGNKEPTTVVTVEHKKQGMFEVSIPRADGLDARVTVDSKGHFTSDVTIAVRGLDTLSPVLQEAITNESSKMQSIIGVNHPDMVNYRDIVKYPDNPHRELLFLEADDVQHLRGGLTDLSLEAEIKAVRVEKSDHVVSPLATPKVNDVAAPPTLRGRPN